MTEFPEGSAALRAEIARLRAMVGGSTDPEILGPTNALIAELERRARQCENGDGRLDGAAGPPEPQAVSLAP